MKTFESLFNEHKKVEMTQEEKSRVWNTIEMRTFNAPVRNGIPSRLYSRGSPLTPAEGMFFKKRAYALSLFVGSVILCGGVSAYAQTTLPGNILYPVKTQVVEKVRRAVAFTPHAKAVVEADLANERLLEIERLAVQGHLTEDIAAHNTRSFEKHVTRFENELHTLQIRSQQENVFLLSQNFHTKLIVHAAVVKTLKENSPEQFPTTETLDLESALLAYSVQASAISEKSNTHHTSSSTPSSIIDTTTAERYIQALRNTLGIDTEITVTLTDTKQEQNTPVVEKNKTPTPSIPASTTVPTILNSILTPSRGATSAPTHSTSSINISIQTTSSSTASPIPPSVSPLISKEPPTSIEKVVEKITETLPVQTSLPQEITKEILNLPGLLP